MARSIWKGPFVDITLIKKAEKVMGSGRKEVIKTWSRRSTILPQFIGLTFGVYNGQKFVPVTVKKALKVTVPAFHDFGKATVNCAFSSLLGSKSKHFKSGRSAVVSTCASAAHPFVVFGYIADAGT